jgi:metallo-beta-lactamase class B
MGADDWALVEKDTRTPRPKRDIVATDGMEIRVGDQKVTLYLTPGHTLGTLSTLVPVKDGGRNHLAAAWGGTSFSAATPREQVNLYVNFAVRFRDIAAKAGHVIGKDAVSRYLTVAEECARVELAGS